MLRVIEDLVNYAARDTVIPRCHLPHHHWVCRWRDKATSGPRSERLWSGNRQLQKLWAREPEIWFCWSLAQFPNEIDRYARAFFRDRR